MRSMSKYSSVTILLIDSLRSPHGKVAKDVLGKFPSNMDNKFWKIIKKDYIMYFIKESCGSLKPYLQA